MTEQHEDEDLRILQESLAKAAAKAADNENEIELLIDRVLDTFMETLEIEARLNERHPLAAVAVGPGGGGTDAPPADVPPASLVRYKSSLSQRYRESSCGAAAGRYVRRTNHGAQQSAPQARKGDVRMRGCHFRAPHQVVGSGRRSSDTEGTAGEDERP